MKSTPSRRTTRASSRRPQLKKASRRPSTVSTANQQKAAAWKLVVGWLIVVSFSCVLALFVWSVSARPVKHESGWVVFHASSDRDELLRDLYHQRLIDEPRLFALFLRCLVPWTEVRPGAHVLAYGLSARELVQRLGQSPARPIERVTLIEGFTRWDVAERLHQAGIAAREPFLAAVSDPQLLAELQINAASAEGYLFPATYPFALDTDPAELVRRLVKETRKRVERIKARAPQRLDEFSELELLILASIVEKETGRADERPRIAQVFLNRLARPEEETLGRLQSDPTAGYGCRLDPQSAPSCQNFTGKISPQMLGDSKNLYNTYRHAGLPPGPIGNPGSAAIEAVLFPAGGDELFFVADGDGGHRFSASFEDHRRAVEALRLKRKSAP